MIIVNLFELLQGYEGSLLKVTSKNGKTASVSLMWTITIQIIVILLELVSNKGYIFSLLDSSRSTLVLEQKPLNKIFRLVLNNFRIA